MIDDFADDQFQGCYFYSFLKIRKFEITRKRSRSNILIQLIKTMDFLISEWFTSNINKHTYNDASPNVCESIGYFGFLIGMEVASKLNKF